MEHFGLPFETPDELLFFVTVLVPGGPRAIGGQGGNSTPVMGDLILQETGSTILQENGDDILQQQ